MEGGDHGHRHQDRERDRGGLGPQAEGGGLARVERHRHEGTVPDDRRREGQRQRGGEDGEVDAADPQHVTEEESGQVHREALRSGHDDHPECEHADQEQPNAGVGRQFR